LTFLVGGSGSGKTTPLEAIAVRYAIFPGGRHSCHENASGQGCRIRRACSPRQIVANLPYNVGTPLLVGWMRRLTGLFYKPDHYINLVSVIT
jgi:hypothetical protein